MRRIWTRDVFGSDVFGSDVFGTATFSYKPIAAHSVIAPRNLAVKCQAPHSAFVRKLSKEPCRTQVTASDHSCLLWLSSCPLITQFFEIREGYAFDEEAAEQDPSQPSNTTGRVSSCPALRNLHRSTSFSESNFPVISSGVGAPSATT